VGDPGVEASSADDGPAPSVDSSQQDAAIGRLTAAAGVEDGPVEHDQVAAIRALHGPDAGLDGAGVGVPVADRGLHTATLSDGRKWQLSGRW